MVGPPLVHAAYTIVQALLDAGADVNAKDNNGETALIQAASTGHTETVQALLDAGADVDAEGAFEMTALMWAKRKGHTEIVELLKKAGARE